MTAKAEHLSTGRRIMGMYPAGVILGRNRRRACVKLGEAVQTVSRDLTVEG